jgi:hypothetical protein
MGKRSSVLTDLVGSMVCLYMSQYVPDVCLPSYTYLQLMCQPSVGGFLWVLSMLVLLGVSAEMACSRKYLMTLMEV